jgi:LacI family transcriptional regulator
MPTMADVARSAGVSVATVSHVLNDTRPVLPHTRQAVLDAIEELGYTPNTLARSLVTSRTRSIGLAVSAISNPYFTEILQGVEAGALEHGYSLLIADPHDDPEHERKVVQLLHERRVDGMIVAPSADPRELVAYLSRHDMPAVFLDRVVDSPEDGTPRFDQVCADSAEPTAGLVTHLAGLGHRRIALVAGRPGLSTTGERITGYRHGLAAAGLPFDERLVVHGDSESAGGQRATAALLSLAAPPTALVTANNTMTLGALRALRERGLSVPEDIALCCFDDFAWADLFTPRLTAIAQPSKEIGTQAVRVLLERLAAPERAARTVRLACTFVHRTSCGCTGEPERHVQRRRPLRSGGAAQSSQAPQSQQSQQSQ